MTTGVARSVTTPTRTIERLLPTDPLWLPDRASDNPPKITIDFETRSACPIDRGPWLYSIHPTTQVLCLSYKIGEGPTRRWHCAMPEHGIEESPPPQDLFDAIASGMLVEAHNRFFEFCIWTHQMMTKYGWPAIGRDQWRCSAAKAAFYGLPRNLEGAVRALNLPIEKDMEGNKLMRRLCKPRKPLKKERAAMIAAGRDPDKEVLWHGSREEFERLWLYCDRDVEAEHAFSAELPDLSPSELRIWQMDQDMNARGITCDVEMVKSAIWLRDREVEALNRELSDITGGEIASATARASFVDWMQRQGVDLPDTQGKTLDKFIKKKLRPDLHHAIRIVREVNRTSTAKYDSMLERVCPDDDRLRDLMMYHGAGTGRWSGKGVQPHNFPRGGIKDIEIACQLIRERDVVSIRALYGDVMKHLSDSLRGALIAARGKELTVADYAAIEARVVFWLARDNTALDVFRRGEDIYCDLATGIYGFPVLKKSHPNERQFGKQGILGLGFEMGFATFLLTCRKYDIFFTEGQARAIVKEGWSDLEYSIREYLKGDKRRVRRLMEADIDYEASMHELVLMKYTVNTYRSRYPEVVQMWRDQEAAAIQAVRHPGRIVECQRGRNVWVVEGRFLRTYLPSGRPLNYCDPRIIQRKTPWGAKKPVLVFMGVHPLTKKWCPQDTYGGKLVENITQATARDLLADAMVRADDDPRYDVLLSVHDELINEALKGQVDRKEFEKFMAIVPVWADGCPVDAEAWIGERYRK